MTQEILRVDTPRPPPPVFYNFPAPDEGLLDEFRTRVEAAVRYAISCTNKYKPYVTFNPVFAAKWLITNAQMVIWGEDNILDQI